jgi:hypothetical protein
MGRTYRREHLGVLRTVVVEDEYWAGQPWAKRWQHVRACCLEAMAALGQEEKSLGEAILGVILEAEEQLGAIRCRMERAQMVLGPWGEKKSAVEPGR